MDSDKHRRISEIFLAAAELEPGDRAAYLDEACAGDDELRGEVESLLSQEEKLPEEMVENLLGVMAPDLELTGVVDPQPDPESVGPYRILRRIGEGGMGVVYLAEQSGPVRRKVALKLIKLGMQSAQVLARFEIERRALALMSHGNIARVFDAGATNDGRPYVVMEYVPGAPLTEYCDRRRLGTDERLRLFMEVCRAVQHAHQKGIIHRDLKPSNILVMEQDDGPIPKVIDFGIAKATEQRLTERSVFTQVGRMIGTPEYMSPEQAGAVHQDIDTRSDVYSLGIILYEMLVGVLPLDGRLLRSAAHDEIQRVIREVEPTRPSARLITLGHETNDVARRRGTDSRALSRSLRGDLDWITLRALAKDRSRRYDSASELAADLARHLADEPVEAGPPSAAYRLRKFVRRNRGKMAAAVLVLVSLVAGIVGEEIQRRRASHHAAVAEERFQRLMELTGLSDADLARQFLREAEDLWPARPETIPAIRDWLTRVAALTGRQEFHRETLAKLRAKALTVSNVESISDPESQPTLRFSDSEQQWEYERLHEVVQLVDRLTDPDPATGVIANVRVRLEEAETVGARTIDELGAKWEEAIASISNSTDCPAYDGLEIAPQMGLVPLGQDPDSGLWEFGYPQTGSLPKRNPEGRLLLDETVGLVFVLIPGGSLNMGSDGETIGVEIAEFGKALRVDLVEPGLFGDRLGLLEGDVIASLNGEAMTTIDDLNYRATTLHPGDVLTVSVLREGALLELRGRIPRDSAPLFAGEDELPSRVVHFEPFFISKYEMTQGQWVRHVGTNPSAFSPHRNPDRKTRSLLHPVENVTWKESLRVLSQLDLILPTEGQWEYVARGGTDTVWFPGDDARSIAGHANIADRFAHENGLEKKLPYESWLDDGYTFHAPVGHYTPNSFGIHDVVGNVWEWCRDWYQSYDVPVRAGDGLSLGSPSGGRVIRGGSWRDMALESRSGVRGYEPPDEHWFDVGVRPARRLHHDEASFASP